MKSSLKFLIITMLFSFALQISALSQYNNFSSMSKKIIALGNDFPSICSIKTITKTAGGKEIWVISIGIGNKDNKPGIAVFGGIEGSHILGKELALGFAESLLHESSNPEIKELLNKVSFYVFPDISPDATEQFFSDLKYERIVNNRSTDDDRDFEFDEDPYEDLNKDGNITMIRIKDPSGKYIESSDDSRIMVPADISKGQKGNFLLYSEGIDNDKDGNFNEDGLGGVNFNRNFTYNYEEFGLNAGLYPVSEPETKAVADYLFDRFNIYTVFLFGPQDNLGQPQKASERDNNDRRITSILKSDELINKLVSDKYHEITGIKGAPPASKTPPGNFMDWVYFHYGRYCFSTPAWWYPVEKGENSEIAFLKYAKKENLSNVFVPWTEISHPGFPDKKTEVGGIKPFVMLNPKADTLGDLITKNYRFITAIANMHPELEFLDIKTESAGDDIFRLSLKLHNSGIFATCAESGERNMWTRIMRISLETDKGQNFLSGQKVQRIKRLEGNEMIEYNWLIRGKGKIKVVAGAINTGTISTSVELK